MHRTSHFPVIGKLAMSRLQIETELAGTCPIGMLGLLPMYEYVSWSVGR